MSRPALAWNPSANKMQLVVQGSSNTIWTASFSPTGAFNNDWIQLPGAILDSPTITWNSMAGKMQMMVRGSNNYIWAATFNSAGTFNNDWANITGAILDPPGLAWNPTAGTYMIVVRGVGDTIWAATPSTLTPLAPLAFSLPYPISTRVCQGFSYTYQLPTASGGDGSPYYYQLDPLGGYPPSGISLNLTSDGLSGVSSAAGGVYPMTICALDTDGFQSCKPTYLTLSTICSGSMTGSYSGTCLINGATESVGGSVIITINSYGYVSGSYYGSSSGYIAGSVDVSGNLTASGSAGGYVTWTGQLGHSGTYLWGSGSWSQYYPGVSCNGAFSGAGSAGQ